MDPKERILDASLEEVLGEQTPSDLTARILRALAEREPCNDAAADGLDKRSAVLPPVFPAPIAPPVQVGPLWRHSARLTATSKSVAKSAPCQASRLNWLAMTIAASVLAIGGGFGWLLVEFAKQPTGHANRIVEAPPSHTRSDLPPTHDRGNGDFVKKPSNGSLSGPSKESTDDSSWQSEKKGETGFGASTFDVVQELPTPTFDRARRRLQTASSPHSEIVAFLNESIRAQWEKHQIVPAHAATEQEWCQRAYAWIVGRNPTDKEMNRFVQSRDVGKRTELVDHLLASDDYSLHWSSVWSNVLLGHPDGGARNEWANRDAFSAYLRKSFAQNKPYDQLVFELLTATGTATPTSESWSATGAAEEGAVNFLIAGATDNANGATGQTGRIFLGRNLQCAQCHDDPVGGWTQQEFWQLNAFFQQMRLQRHAQSGNVALVNRDFVGESGTPEEAEVYYPQPSGVLKVAYPVLPDGTEVDRSGLLSDIDRRAVLAEWIVQSDDLNRAVVNRMWTYYLSYGLTPRVDEMGPRYPPFHAELLDRLAIEFAAHGYNLKALQRWITLSDVFGLSSEVPTDQQVDAPETGKPPLFSRFYLRPSQPTRVTQSLLAARDAFSTEASAQEQALARRDWLNRMFGKKTAGTGKPDVAAGPIDPIPNSLLNTSPQHLIPPQDADLLKRLAESRLSQGGKIEHLFQLALARKPKRNELELANELMASSEGEMVYAMEILWWSLLNSNELTFGHVR